MRLVEDVTKLEQCYGSLIIHQNFNLSLIPDREKDIFMSYETEETSDLIVASM